MMSLAGASRAVVPGPADCPAALFADPAAGPNAADPAAGAATDPDGTASACAADEPAELAELAEHPASSIPPASMAPPMAEAAARDGMRLVGAGLRVELDVFSMRV